MPSKPDRSNPSAKPVRSRRPPAAKAKAAVRRRPQSRNAAGKANSLPAERKEPKPQPVRQPVSRPATTSPQAVRAASAAALPETGGIDLRQVAEAMADGLCLIDDTLKVTWANAAARSFFGAAIVGRHKNVAFRAIAAEGIDPPCPVEQTFADCQPHQGAKWYATIGAKRRFFQCTTAVARRNRRGRAKTVALFFRDLTERVEAESALRETNNNLDAIFNAITASVFLMDQTGKVLCANAELARRLDCRVEEVVGKFILDFVPAEVADRRRRYGEEVVRTGKPVEFEDQRGDRVIATSMYPVFDSRGGVIRLAVYSQDVSEQRRAEDALRKSEENYRRIVETAAEGIWMLDADCLTTYVNRRLADMLGYAPDEMIGQPVYAFLFAEDRDRHSAQAESRRKGEAGTYERRFRCKDGSELWAIVSASALKGAESNFAGSFAMLTDITSRKRAEEALLAYESIVSSAQDGLALVGRDYVYKTVNDTYLRRYGLARDRFVGRPAAEVMGQTVFDTVIKSRLDRCLAGETLTYSEWFSYPALGRRYMEVTYSPCRDRRSEIIGAAVVVRDTTDRKRAEEILEARLSLSEKAGTLTMDELLQHTLDEAERATGSRIGFFHFVGEDEQTLALQTWSTNTLRKMCAAVASRQHYNIDQAGVWVDCIRARRPVIHNDYAALPHRRGLPEGHVPVVRELVVPILRNDRIVAVLGLGNKLQDYDEKDVETVSSLANLAWDIVLRKRAEEQLELQGMVLDQARDHIAIINLEGIITFVNQAKCLAKKRKRDELIGKHIAVLGDASAGGATQQQIIDATLESDEWHGELVDESAGGTSTVEDLRTFLVRNRSGKAVAICGIGTDITARRQAEQDRLFFEQMVTSSTDAIVLLDPDYSYRAANDTYLRWVGLTREQLLDRTISDVLGPAFFEAVIKPHLDRCLQGEAVSLAEWVEYPGAGKRFVEVTLAPCRDRSSAIVGTVAVARDVTQRKQTEAERDAAARALHHSEALLRTTLSSTAEGVLVVDDAGRVLLVSPRFQELWRIPAEIMAEGSDENLLAHVRDQLIDPEGFLDKVKRVYRSNEEIFDKVLFKDGRVFERFSMPLLQERRTIGRAWSFRDVTQREQAERALVESRDRLELVYATMPDALLMADIQTGIIVDANPAAASLLGRPIDQIIGLHFSRLHPPFESGSAAADFHEHASSTAPGAPKQHFVIRPDGSQVPVEVTAASFEMHGRRMLQGIFRDISERKKAEEELRLSQIKLRDLYHQLQSAREEERRRISREIHDDLGQNVTALKLDIAWLARKVGAGQTELVRKLESMQQIVNSTLETVRRVSTELRPGILDSLGLSAAVEWLVRDFEKRSEIRCDLRIEPEEVESAPGLATDIFRILQEALTNVARHALATQAQVTLRQEDDKLELQVIDNGIGIPDEQKTGSGSLGLLGIRERLLAHGGRLDIEALPGRGTSIRATVPTGGSRQT